MQILLPTFELLGFTHVKYVAHGEYYIIKICYGTTTKPIQNKRKWDIHLIKLQFSTFLMTTDFSILALGMSCVTMFKMH